MRESHDGVKTTAHKHSTTINAADYQISVEIEKKNREYDLNMACMLKSFAPVVYPQSQTW